MGTDVSPQDKQLRDLGGNVPVRVLVVLSDETDLRVAVLEGRIEAHSGECGPAQGPTRRLNFAPLC
jgi:hypothetical protein